MYKTASQYIREQLPDDKIPEIGMILGSGLGIWLNSITDPLYINYSSIPGFPQTTVEGHKGRFVCGRYQGKSIIAMQAAFHYYEGKNIDEVVLPVRVMKELGIKYLF